MEFTEPQECASCHAILTGYRGPHYRLDDDGKIWVRCGCGNHVPIDLTLVLIGEDEARSVFRGAGISEVPGRG